MLSSVFSRMQKSVRSWTLRKHGIAVEPFTIPHRRIYILPTGLGLAFAFMLFAMFIGAMNYANNLALGLAFLLGALALTTMHYCHRNLAGMRLSAQSAGGVFAGHPARFHIALENESSVARPEIRVGTEHHVSEPQRIEPLSREVFTVEVPTQGRGYVQLKFLEISTRHPFGLFRSWSLVPMSTRAIVYPKPSERSSAPPPSTTDTGGAQDRASGDEDFAGLRAFHRGDPPGRIAWKAYARGMNLQVKQYAGTAVASHVFDWDSLPGLDVEARLSQLCRWIEDAYAAGRAFGLRLPQVEIAPNIGAAHRHHCLTALALFDVTHASA